MRVYLSENQKAKMKEAYNKGLDKTKPGNTNLDLNQTQLNKYRKATTKTVDLTLSKSQVGGFLPLLIPAGIAAAKALGVGGLGYLGSKLAQKISGNGLKVPVGRGLKVPGK